MRYSQGEKMEIIHMVENSDMAVKKTLEELDVPRSSFYAWYGRYQAEGFDGLGVRMPAARRFWNKIPKYEKERIVSLALAHPEKSPREVAWYVTDQYSYFVSESSVYRILKAYDLVPSPSYVVLAASETFKNPTRRVHELWQTDFTYLKVIGWGWYYLGSVLDDFSRYIISWKLFPTMAATDVKEVLDLAVERTGVTEVAVRHRPRLLTDNGPCYVSGELETYLRERGMEHTRGAPYHPMTQGKIERFHRSMKNEVRLQNYYLPGELEEEIRRFIEYYNNERYHESLKNVTPADVYFGRYKEIESRREKIKRKTLKQRRKLNLH
jgi:putative transposase